MCLLDICIIVCIISIPVNKILTLFMLFVEALYLGT